MNMESVDWMKKIDSFVWVGLFQLIKDLKRIEKADSFK